MRRGTRGFFALALLLGGCVEAMEDASTGFVLLDREAREAGARLYVDGRRVTDLLPERVELGAEVIVDTDGEELSVPVAGGEIVVLRGDDARAEPFVIGAEASDERLFVAGSREAADALAARFGADVIARADGAFELHAPALLSVAGDYDALEGIEDVAPVLVDGALAEAVGLPSSAALLGEAALAESARTAGESEAIRLAAAFMGEASAARDVTGSESPVHGDGPSIAPAKLADAPTALLVGVYRSATDRLVIDVAGGFEIHPIPDLRDTEGAPFWEVSEAPLPAPTTRGRVIATADGHALVPGHGERIALDVYADGSITVAGERYQRLQEVLRPICRIPARQGAP